MLELLLTYLCHVALLDELALCAHKSCYGSTWFIFFAGPFNICFEPIRYLQ